MAVELLGVSCIRERSTGDAIAEQSDPDLLSRCIGGTPQKLHPGKARPGKEGRAEDGRVEGPGLELAEAVVVGIPQGKGEVDRRVIQAGLGDVHVSRKGNIHVLDSVSPGWKGDSIRVVQPVE